MAKGKKDVLTNTTYTTITTITTNTTTLKGKTDVFSAGKKK